MKNKLKELLGTSETCSMSHLSHQPSEPAYYIEDFRISNEASTMNCKNLHLFASKGQGFTASPSFHVVIQGQRKFTW